MNAGCREKDLKHINEQLEKYNVRCLIHPTITTLYGLLTRLIATVTGAEYTLAC